MRLWTAFWLLVVVVFAAFTIINWGVLSAPTAIDLVVAEVRAPLGLLMLGGTLGLALMFLLFIVWLETTTLVGLGRANGPDTRAESRLDDLRQQMTDLRSTTDQSRHAIVNRLERVEQIVRNGIETGAMDPDTLRVRTRHAG